MFEDWWIPEQMLELNATISTIVYEWYVALLSVVYNVCTDSTNAQNKQTALARPGEEKLSCNADYCTHILILYAKLYAVFADRY